MSVILFHSSEVYTELSKAYEGLKHQHIFHLDINDEDFYRALRRLYFANVAAYLCNYHDETPLTGEELQSIETFSDFGPCECDITKDVRELVYDFCSAWGSLVYNLNTNAGEFYKAEESYTLLKRLADHYAQAYIKYFREEN